jgi:hypothetical protein
MDTTKRTERASELLQFVSHREDVLEECARLLVATTSRS